MRTTRTFMGGLMAGLGTTGTMVAASACLFFVASTLIAFNSWTGSGISDRIESLFVGDRNPSVAFDVPGPQVVAASATAAAATVAPAAGGPSSATVSAADTGAGAADLGPVSGSGDLGSGVGVDGAGPGSSSEDLGFGLPPAPDISLPSPPDVNEVTSAQATPNLGGVVEDTTSTLGGTVEQTTGALGSTLGGVSQPIGDTVTSTGQTLGGTITSTGQTVGDILDANG